MQIFAKTGKYIIILSYIFFVYIFRISISIYNMTNTSYFRIFILRYRKNIFYLFYEMSSS